jgi:hypothetical protein
MPTCASGWQPNPGLEATSKLLDAAQLLGNVWTIVSKKWTRAGNVGQIVGSIPVLKLCSLNPDDPGDLTISNFEADLTDNLLPGFGSPEQTIGRWLFQKCLYTAFHASCYCPDTAGPPPAPVTVTEPPGAPDYPTDPGKQDQQTRIENNTASNQEGLTLVYNLIQDARAFTVDGWYTSAPQFVTSQVPLAQSVSGEGVVDLPLGGSSEPSTSIPTWLNVVANIEQLPHKVGIRGTLNPRYYGVGSIWWDGNGSSFGSPISFQRESIHYQQQAFEVPRRVVVYRMGYRLMPGAVVSFYACNPGTDSLRFASNNRSSYYWVPGHALEPPPNFTDPPLYPLAPPALAGRRIFTSAAPP